MAGMDDIDEVDEEHIQLPDTWPIWDAVKSNTVTFATLEDKKLIRLYKNTLFDDSFVYPMTHKKRGNVVVINNEIFLNKGQRIGTEHDVNKIKKIFRQLRFYVKIYENLKCSEMKTRLLKESKADYSNHDCFILFILSHGDNGVVLGTDADTENESNSLSLDEITSLFSESKTLLGKPKLFFIQACQGDQYDEGEPLGCQASNASQYKQIDLSQSAPVNSDDEISESEETDGPKIPSKADVFLSQAAVEGSVSWRNKKYGSLYIQAIGYVFRKFAYKYELHALMTLVHHLVSKAEAGHGQFKQMPKKSDTLRKKCYFFPKMFDILETIVKIKRASNKIKLQDRENDVKIGYKRIDESIKTSDIGLQEGPGMGSSGSQRAAADPPAKSWITTLILGRSGNQNSWTANFIVGKEVFEINRGSDDFVETKLESIKTTFNGKHIRIVKGPGLVQNFNVNICSQVVSDCLSFISTYDAILYVTESVTEKLQDDIHIMDTLENIMGKDVFRNQGILVSVGSSQRGKDLNESFKPDPNFKHLVAKFRDRVIFFNNQTSDIPNNEFQVTHLIKVIENLRIN